MEQGWSSMLLSLVGLLISVASLFIPFEVITDRFFPLRDEQAHDEKYSDVYKTLHEDFNRSNPAIGEDALDNFLNEAPKTSV